MVMGKYYCRILESGWPTEECIDEWDTGPLLLSTQCTEVIAQILVHSSPQLSPVIHSEFTAAGLTFAFYSPNIQS